MRHISWNYQADIDNSGTIDYGEFIAATLHINKVEKEDKLFAAFSYFDKDGSGYITQDELQKACEEFGIGDTRLEDIIGDIDQDNVSRPDFTIPIKIGKISMFNSSIIYFAGWTDRLQWVCCNDAEGR